MIPFDVSETAPVRRTVDRPAFYQSWSGLSDVRAELGWREQSASTGERDFASTTPGAAIERAFDLAALEEFEDCMQSRFSTDIQRIIAVFGDEALIEVNALLQNPKTPVDVVVDCLITLGAISDRATRPYRSWILQNALGSNRVRIRDAAVLGLRDLADPSSAFAIRDAFEREPSEMLREDLRELLAHLQTSPNALAHSKAI